MTEARAQYNAYLHQVVRPQLGLAEADEDQLGFVGIAQRMHDPVQRRQYIENAVAMLRANIAHYRPFATPRVAPQPSNTISVVGTLLIAGLAYHLRGPVAALVSAGVAYWLLDRAVRRLVASSQREVEDHNAGVDEWGQSLKEWETAIDELRRIET